MEDIISQMIDYEKQAQTIINHAKERQMSLGAAVMGEVEDMRKQYIERAQKRIDTYRGSEEEYLQNMIKEIDEKRVSQLQRIKKAYEENNLKWVKDIFESIVNDL